MLNKFKQKITDIRQIRYLKKISQKLDNLNKFKQRITDIRQVKQIQIKNHRH